MCSFEGYLLSQSKEKCPWRCLTAVPPSLFYDEADLAKKLESVVEETQQLPNVSEPSAYIIDGMALLQSIHDSGFQTFNDIRVCLTTLMGKEGINCVVIVFDKYDHQHSIKDPERHHPNQQTNTYYHRKIVPTVPNYRK